MTDQDDSRRFVASPTMAQFLKSEAYVRLIAGPMGSGKSVLCTHTLLEWATKQAPNRRGERRSRFLIVRNTRDQLMSTTWKTVVEWVPPGEFAEWKSTEKTLYVQFEHQGTTVKSEWLFVALDEPADVRKALSLEATGAWLNEWRELHPDVIDGLLGRVNRFPPPKDGTPITRAGVIMDTNMPAEETWHWEQMENPPANWSVHIQPPAILTLEEYRQQELEDPDEDPIVDHEGEEWYVNPKADNTANLSPGYYRNLVPGKKPDYIRAFLRCKYARSMSGVPIYDKVFNADYHIAADPVKPIVSESYPVVMGIDFGRTPAAVFLQRDVRGRVVILSELTSDGMGLETFLATKVKPHVYAHYQRCPIVAAPDPAGFAKQQLGEVTPADVLRREGFKVARPTTNDPEKRIQCVERLLMQQLEGKSQFLVNRECTELIKGFRYGYRYKAKRTGDIDDKPDKNMFSHVHDALQYACLIAEQGATGSYYQTQRREVQAVSMRGWT